MGADKHAEVVEWSIGVIKEEVRYERKKRIIEMFLKIKNMLIMRALCTSL